MKDYNKDLYEFRAQMARKKHLESVLPEMRKQKVDLVQKVNALDEVRIKEEHDVEKMEGGSLASFFYNVVGKKDQKLDKERQEAYEARVKYDAAVSELEAMTLDIDKLETEAKQLFGCEVKYQKAFDEKLAYLKESDAEVREKVRELEEKLAFLEQQEVEIQEAVFAGQSALEASHEVLNNLDDADHFSTWDMFGGGLLVDLKKHDCLDQAQAAVQTLQIRLNRFKTELADVTIHADINVKIDGFLHFADFFFDGLFADWKVRDQIHTSIDSAESTHNKIKDVLFKLTAMKDALLEEKYAVGQQIEKLVLER